MSSFCHTQWLRFDVVTQSLKKLKDWTLEDVAALAVQEYGSTRLNKQQLAGLIKILRGKQPAKAETGDYAKIGITPAAFEVSWRCNKAQHGAAGWKDAAGYLKPTFSSEEDTVRYAWDLLLLDESLSWKELQAVAKKGQIKCKFAPLIKHGAVSLHAQKVLKKEAKKLQALLTPMPDNLDLNRRYWSLEAGDRVIDPSGQSKTVLSVQINPGSSPTVRIEA